MKLSFFSSVGIVKVSCQKAWKCCCLAACSILPSLSHSQEPTSAFTQKPVTEPKFRPGEDPFAVPAFPTQVEVSTPLLKRTTPGTVLGANIGSHTVSGTDRILDDIFQDNQVLTTNMTAFGYEPSLKVTGRYTLHEEENWELCGEIEPHRLQLELGLLMTGQYRERNLIADPLSQASLISRFASPDVTGWTTRLHPFDQGQSWLLDYQSRILSAELNLRWNETSIRSFPMQLLAGFRFFKLQEKLFFGAGSDLFGNTPVDPYAAQYQINTDNNYFGLQVGGDLAWRVSSRFSVVGSGRSGLLLGSSYQKSVLQGGILTSGNAYNDFGSASTIGLSRLFEFGLRTDVRLTSQMKLMLGYQGMYVTDMALAPRQLQFTTEPGSRSLLDRNGNLFLFGPSAGIEIHW